VFVPEDHHKSSPKRTKKKTQKFKFETLLAVICLQCGKNKSQVREIGGGGRKKKPERVDQKWQTNTYMYLYGKQGCFLCITEKRHIVGQNRAVFSQELHASYV
jgi:hypothetical protein